MHSFQTHAFVSFLGLTVLCAVASSADMLTAFTIPSLLSKPDLSVQVLAPGSVFSSVEGNTTVEGFDDKAQDTSPANTKNDPYELDEQPEYCPNIHDTLMCRDCGGYTYFFYEEHEYYDARCKGVGDDEHLKDCCCLEREESGWDSIGCNRLGDDPDAFHREAAEAFARLPDLTCDSFADTSNHDSVYRPEVVEELEAYIAEILARPE